MACNVRNGGAHMRVAILSETRGFVAPQILEVGKAAWTVKAVRSQAKSLARVAATRPRGWSQA